MELNLTCIRDLLIYLEKELTVENINYTGHEFLQNIKPLGSASLPVISQVASQIIHSKLLDI